MKALVSIHHERPPHPLIADVEAFNVDRVLAKAGRGGPFAFDVVMSDVHRDVLKHGRIAVIKSITNVLPYVGVIKHTEQDAAAGTVEISGDNYASVFYGMALNRSAPAENRGAGRIAERLIEEAQGMGRSVFVTSAATSGTRLPARIDFGSQHLGAALDALATRVDDEWWIEHIVERNRITHVFRWEKRRGFRRLDMLLQEATHFVASDYKTEALGTIRSAAAVGGGGPTAGRPSVVVANQPVQALGKAESVQASTVAQPDTSPLIARDVIAYRALDTNQTILADVARRALERPLISKELIGFTVVSSVWPLLFPGDWVRCRWHSLNYGGLDRWVRIAAMQPDEDAVECDVAIEQAA